jgi:LysR family nitrogen assimilation transcriptional regulator
MSGRTTSRGAWRGEGISAPRLTLPDGFARNDCGVLSFDCDWVNATMITIASRGFFIASVQHRNGLSAASADQPRPRFAATAKRQEGRVVTESLRDIRIFVAAYEERSFTAAAVREHATQSGVSQHIRKLEEGFGVKLFSREKGQVAPTPAADAYYSRCIQILRNIESSNEAMKVFTGISGDVFVGLMPTMTRATLAPAIQRVVSEHPNMKIHVTESYSPILIQKVLAAELDFAIVPAVVGSRGLKVQHFLRTWETLVASPDKKLHLCSRRLRDLGPLKIVLPSHANARRKPLEAYFTTNGVEIERWVEMDAMMGTLDLVSNSDWVTVIPALMMTAEIERMQFSVIPIVDPTATLDLVVIEPMRRTLNVAARAFLDIIRVEAVGLNNLWRPYFE